MESLLAVLLCAALLPPVSARDPVPSVCRNGFYLVQGMTLLRFDEHGRRQVTVAHLPVQVNAVAYLPREEILVGIAEFHGHSHIVNIDLRGTVVDRGIALKGLSGAYAATMNGQGLLIRSGDYLLTIDPATLKIVARVRLSAPADIGDWDVHPADGKLYGLMAGQAPRLIRIDPLTGVVTTVALLPELPSGSSFGAVAIEMQGNLHAFHNRTGRIYHLPLAQPDRFTFSEFGSSTRQSDAARCPIAWDFGDAPDSYARSGNGPRHTITTVETLSIGETVAEDGLPNELTVDAGATSLSVTVAVRNTTGQPALLAGWHDLDADGTFTSGERTTEIVPADADASQSTDREAASLTEAFRSAKGLAPQDREDVQTLIGSYLREVTDHEWASLQERRASTPKAEDLFTALRDRAEAVEPATERQQTASQQLVGQITEAADARRARLSAAGQGMPDLLWPILVAGGFVSIMFLYFFGLARTFPNGLMMAVVGGMVALMLFVVYQVEYPFSRGFAISPDSFRTATSQLTGP